MEPLLQRYINEELCDTRRLLVRAVIAEAQNNSSVAVRELDGNHFDVEINFESGQVSIQDILTSDANGSLVLPLPVFLDAVGIELVPPNRLGQ